MIIIGRAKGMAPDSGECPCALMGRQEAIDPPVVGPKGNETHSVPEEGG